MSMKHIKDFTGLYPISKTLRFELKPIGETLMHIKKDGILEEDHQRKKDYEVVKKIIDDYHRGFIDSTLSQVNINWRELAEAIASEDAEILKDIQDKKRKELIDYFDNNPDENKKKLFSKELFDELLPELLEEKDGLSAEEKKDKLEAVSSFNKFTTYFTGFHENRKNMYSDEKKSTSISYRVVDQNFPKFLSNVKTFNFIKENAPAIIQQTQNELADYLNGMSLEEIFSIDYYNKVLTQRGIVFYNTIIGGVAGEAGTQTKRGINQFSNLFKQQNPDFTKAKQTKMLPLYKQILSDRETFSVIPKSVETDEEMMLIISELLKSLEEKEVLKKAHTLFSVDNVATYSLEKIWVSHSELPNLSTALFGSWEAITKSLSTQKEDEIGSSLVAKNKKQIDSYLKSTSFSLSEIDKAVEFYRESLPEEKRAVRTGDYFKLFISLKQQLSEAIKRYKHLEENAVLNLIGNEEQSSIVKELMDALISLVRFIKPFIDIDRTDIDTEFYSDIFFIHENCTPIITIYNAARNYITRKPYTTSKYKLNFKNPTLADGWDKNKEQNNSAIILLKDGMFYLGIINAKNKLNSDELAEDGSSDGYKKMHYKLLPGPNKMLPKVFFSKKGIENFNPPESILRGYHEELHKKGKDFNKAFCHKLIDYFKKAINEHPDWCQFDFNFSDTSTYEDISGFYREVETQGYKITFTNLSSEKIDKWVKEGKLYLFKIWNKDFSENSKGRPNMHTLYWQQVFSEENLKEVVFKLNGEAELFYRERSIKEPKSHEKGSVRLNKRDVDGNPINEDLYNELLQFANGKKTKESLSEKAKELIDNERITFTEFDYTIVKDRRFTEDKFAFHVPLTINFKSFGSSRINKDVNLFLKNNSDIKIIGIDRGERHLIYLTLIDRNGKIIEQRSFNIVNQMNYHGKLDQMEKARDKARKSWKSIGKIKDMKEGYLSQVVHEISCMMIENNAIVVMEDLNFGFKRGRFKVEKQVYQKFEKQLIEKLNYLAFKDFDSNENGGVLKGLQLTEEFKSFEKLGKQSGFLFYVPASYTSKIDPTAGFVNLFNFSEFTSQEKRKEFLQLFDSICYDPKYDAFIFDFDYDKFKTYQESHIKKWSVYSMGERIINLKNKSGKWESKKVSPTNDIKAVLEKEKVNYLGGQNILKAIESMDKKSCSDIFNSFRNITQIRNSDSSSGEDFIISPVKNREGVFFDSRKAGDSLPKDADANGAYHIALKGLYLLNSIDENLKENGEINYKLLTISSKDWFKFVQTAPFRK